jgi:hypothetical protein
MDPRVVQIVGCSRSANTTPVLQPTYGRDVAVLVEEPPLNGDRCFRVEVKGERPIPRSCAAHAFAQIEGVGILASSANSTASPQLVVGFAGKDVALELRFADVLYPIVPDPVDGFFAFRVEAAGELQQLTAKRAGKVINVCRRSAPGFVRDLECLPTP